MAAGAAEIQQSVNVTLSESLDVFGVYWAYCIAEATSAARLKQSHQRL